MAKRPAPDRHVTREEFEAMRRTLDECCRNIELQFKRTAAIQAELDRIRRAWQRAAALDASPSPMTEPNG
jgi:hypothetical protein